MVRPALRYVQRKQALYGQFNGSRCTYARPSTAWKYAQPGLIGQTMPLPETGPTLLDRPIHAEMRLPPHMCISTPHESIDEGADCFSTAIGVPNRACAFLVYKVVLGEHMVFACLPLVCRRTNPNNGLQPTRTRRPEQSRSMQGKRKKQGPQPDLNIKHGLD